MSENSSARPLPDALIRLTPAAALGIAVTIAGHTDLWLAACLPLGPLVFGPLLSGRRSIGLSHLISTLELSVSLALGAVATFALIWLGLNVDGLGLLIPLGILFALALAANFVFLTAAGALRALRREVIEYPWVLPLREHLPPLPEVGFGQRR